MTWGESFHEILNLIPPESIQNSSNRIMKSF